MTIIIDFRPLLYYCIPDEASRFIINSLNLVFKENPDHKWLFLGEELYTPETLQDISGQRHFVKKILPGPLGWKIWYDWQIPRLVKKHEADLFISTGGIASAAAIPQAVWIPATTTHKKSLPDKNYSLFYKKRLQNTLQHAQSLLVFSEEEKQNIMERYNRSADKFTVVYSAPDEAGQPLSWTEKENVKIKYAAGKEYFAVAGSAAHEDMIALLKAFSQFKKRQQSDMHLVLTVSGIGSDIDFLEKLESYKYRADVHVFDNATEEEMMSIGAGAYALIYAAAATDPGSVILNAFAAHVPVITNYGGCPKAVMGDAVLYSEINNADTLAAQLMLLYTDETRRNQLIDKAKIQVAPFTRVHTAQQLWAGIMKCVQN